MNIRFFLFIFLFSWHLTGQAADLLEVSQQALMSDPVYQQAIAQSLSTKEGLPIAIANLLPQVGVTANPSVTRSGFAGTNIGDSFSPRNTTTRAYTLTLTVTQTVFDFAKFAKVAGSVATSKGAQATLNANLQNLIIRAATAYFTVLKDEDNLGYSEAAKLAYAERLDQIKQQYKVGLKTITDVYIAQASYDSAVADYINAGSNLANDKENLRVITGKYYPRLSALRKDFPLIAPAPANVEQWVEIARQQNWSIKASQYAESTALQSIRQQFAGHLPTVSVQGTMDRIYADNLNGYRNNLLDRNGPATETDKSVTVNFNLPLFAGGGVVAETKQATYDYQVSQQRLEQTVRDTINSTRQSYLNIIAGISQIKADKQAIKSNMSSLEGMEESYRVGTETLVNVLDQQQKLYLAQTDYATHRYAFVNNVLALKQAAGTLSFDDLRALNVWLTDQERPRVQRKRMGLALKNNGKHY